MCGRRCDALHDGSRVSHYCSEHGSPLKRSLDELADAASDASLLAAGEAELNLDSYEAFEEIAMSTLDPDSEGGAPDEARGSPGAPVGDSDV